MPQKNVWQCLFVFLLLTGTASAEIISGTPTNPASTPHATAVSTPATGIRNQGINDLKAPPEKNDIVNPEPPKSPLDHDNTFPPQAKGFGNSTAGTGSAGGKGSGGAAGGFENR